MRRLICSLILTVFAVATANADPIPAPRMRLHGHCVATSVDGKSQLQIVTLEIPTSKEEGELLMRQMNSDSYWDHFRWSLKVRIGTDTLMSGPRVLVNNVPANGLMPMFDRHGQSSVSVVLPGDRTLAGTEITVGPWMLTPTAADIQAVTQPFAAHVHRVDAMTDENARVYGGPHTVTLRFNCFPTVQGEGVRFGDQINNRWMRPGYDVYHGRFGMADARNFTASFAQKPDTAGRLAVRLHGYDSWYACPHWPAAPTLASRIVSTSEDGATRLQLLTLDIPYAARPGVDCYYDKRDHTAVSLHVDGVAYTATAQIRDLGRTLRAEGGAQTATLVLPADVAVADRPLPLHWTRTPAQDAKPDATVTIPAQALAAGPLGLTHRLRVKAVEGWHFPDGVARTEVYLRFNCVTDVEAIRLGDATAPSLTPVAARGQTTNLTTPEREIVCHTTAVVDTSVAVAIKFRDAAVWHRSTAEAEAAEKK